MGNTKATKPLTVNFLKDFEFRKSDRPFSESDIKTYDELLTGYERGYADPEIEKNLISRNELLVSFAISKAENSALTFVEAVDVYKFLLSNPDVDFVRGKVESGRRITKKDYEKLEFFNIAKTFRYISSNDFRLSDIDSKMIRRMHKMLTQGLDFFADKIAGFTLYKSGTWRSGDLVRVGSYVPARYKEIPKSVTELLDWLKGDFTITNIAIFHTGLYALHPFNNGNKRVCRVLEHILFRLIGLNSNNLYSTSYYYHKQKDRYYKYLLFSLERKDLSFFTAFILEALVLSIVDVIRTSVEVQRRQYLKRLNLDAKIVPIIRPLVKQKEMQYKKLWKVAKKRITNKTFSTYLQNGVSDGYLVRRQYGKNTYYSLKIALPEEQILARWVAEIKTKLAFVPDEYVRV